MSLGGAEQIRDPISISIWMVGVAACHTLPTTPFSRRARSGCYIEGKRSAGIIGVIQEKIHERSEPTL